MISVCPVASKHEPSWDPNCPTAPIERGWIKNFRMNKAALGPQLCCVMLFDIGKIFQTFLRSWIDLGRKGHPSDTQGSLLHGPVAVNGQRSGMAWWVRYFCYPSAMKHDDLRHVSLSEDADGFKVDIPFYACWVRWGFKPTYNSEATFCTKYIANFGTAQVCIVRYFVCGYLWLRSQTWIASKLRTAQTCTPQLV